MLSAPAGRSVFPILKRPAPRPTRSQRARDQVSICRSFADFDPVVVDRFMAGALMPASWYIHAQRFRTVFRKRMRELFHSVDIILTPTTPCHAIRIGQPTIVLNGTEVASRPNVGIYTQPFSFIGLPIVSVPVFEPGSLPLGVQVIGAPYKEEAVLRVAWQLEQMGIARAHLATVKEPV